MDYSIASDNASQTQSMYFSHVTDYEICTIIKNEKQKAHRFRGTCVKILKHSTEVLRFEEVYEINENSQSF